MAELEIFLKENLHPVYQAWYKVWVYWWPVWRAIYSGRNIRRKWDRHNLVREGQYFLDFGCGTGDFAIPAARIVGRHGKVFAVDCNPRQLEMVAKKARRSGYGNIEIIEGDRQSALPSESIDVVWMCDVIHEIREKRSVIEEAHRLLKKNGTLAIYDSLKGKILDYTVGLFSLEKQDGKLLTFVK